MTWLQFIWLKLLTWHQYILFLKIFPTAQFPSNIDVTWKFIQLFLLPVFLLLLTYICVFVWVYVGIAIYTHHPLCLSPPLSRSYSHPHCLSLSRISMVLQYLTTYKPPSNTIRTYKKCSNLKKVLTFNF